MMSPSIPVNPVAMMISAFSIIMFVLFESSCCHGFTVIQDFVNYGSDTRWGQAFSIQSILCQPATQSRAIRYFHFQSRRQTKDSQNAITRSALSSSIQDGDHHSHDGSDISAEEKKEEPTTSNKRSGTGDPLRAATGNRPSLHPIAINAIADALKKRAQQQQNQRKDSTNDQDSKSQQPTQLAFRVSETVQPLDVAITAGGIASDAIAKRKQEEDAVDDDNMKLTTQEEQTIAGRILGVIMRLDELEQSLWKRCKDVTWVGDYDEWTNFGVLESEGEDDPNAGSDTPGNPIVDQRILDDPLFCLNRAECLLALFLQTVEIPQLEKAQHEVPDKSKIDFIDEDRKEVILSL